MNVDLKKLGESLKEVFLNQEKFEMDLVIKEFNGADFLFFYIYESQDDASPIFYFILSPWDAKSKVAPQGAQVFKGGKLIFQTDYTEYVKIRTGLMDAFALQAIGKDPSNARILYIGAGGVAGWSLRALKTYFPKITNIDYKNETNGQLIFEEIGKEIGVKTKFIDKPDFGEYDYIFMHTNSREPVLLEDDVQKLKDGAFISIFSDKNEAVLDVYKDATILVNWLDSFEKESDLIEGKSKGIIDPTQAITIRHLLEGGTLPTKHHIVFRSGGTPMQNVAMLKYLMMKE
ncbi:MAG: hypothetical protein K9L98_02140 [Candidatus Pacebacteria bacterium]|nr:hypothetical protein [Candidatus Paceibacterota bacterium]MCF7862786.1 hypothetical protein [Candidatus Paceibacterota bacterium]